MKDKHISLFGKEPERLFGILHDSLLSDSDIAEGSEASNDEMGELLEFYLQMPVVTETQEKSSMSSILNHVNRQVSATHGFTVQRFLLDPQTEVELLNDLKENGKRLAAQGNTEAKKEVGIILYYGAIASGLVFHYKKISSHSLAKIDSELTMLLEKSWILPEIKELFYKAREVCRHTDEPTK